MTPLQPLIASDPVVHDAAARAFKDLATDWYAVATSGDASARAEKRQTLLRTVTDLGFADALPSPGAREAWADAAVIIRAQARAAAPVDMAALLACGDRAASIGYEPESYRCGEPAIETAGPPAANALALGRCLQITAAMEAALALSLRYTQERKQFGRALSQFQAIQHSLALAAEEVAAGNAITDLALACMVTEGADNARLALLLDAAAVVLGRSVDVIYDICHQVHGAIGFTREYPLHRHSLDLLRWREHLHLLRGGDLRCAERLGDAAVAAQGAWKMVTATMTPAA